MKILTFLLSFLLCSTAQAQTPATNLLVKDGQTVAFLGDSITGVGWSSPGGYIKLVTSGLGAMGVTITPLPCGVGGNRSVEMLARVDNDVISKKPDWMLLNCGVNDVWSRSIDLPTYEKNITAIVDKAQAAGIKVMILPPTPIYEASTNEFNDKIPGEVAFMQKLAKDRNLPCADVHAAWLDYIAAQADPANNNLVTVDGVHPNADGHQLMAKTILTAFGATPDQVTEAEKAWQAAPADAAVYSDFSFNAKIALTEDELAALNKLAADQKVDLRRIIHTASIETSRELLQTEDLSKIYPWDVSKKFGASVKAKLDAMSNVPPGALTGATTEEQAESGFRVEVPMPISEWDALKKAAKVRKVPLSRMFSQTYMETVRDLLVAQGDLSKIWSDDISGKSTPVFKAKLDAIATADGGWTAPAAQ
jgi:lysophospholipase L1-like esterase